MNRVGEEQFSSHPLAFTSTFSISAEAWGKDTTSERCGLGWFFKLVQVLPTSASPDSALVQMRLCLHLEPSTTGLSKPLSFQRIRSTATISNASPSSTPKIDNQTITNTAALLFPTSTIGLFSWTPLPFSFAKNGPDSTIKLRVVVEVLTDGDAPCNFEQRTARVLTDSIRSGHMIDTKFYLHSRHHGSLCASHPRPVFASSAILRQAGSEYLNVFLASDGFKGSEDVAIDIYRVAPKDKDIARYDYDSDSDLEEGDNADDCATSDGETAPQKHNLSRADGLRNELMRLQSESDDQFLRTGRVIFMQDTAFRTWSAFIKYVYFSQIEFSKMQSTYENTSQASIRFADEQKCSPKSMYRLADKFGIEPLKKVALANIKFQLTNENILKEIFSRFTSKYPEVLAAEVDFLLKNCSSDVIQAGVNEALKKLGSPRDHHLLFALQKIVEGIISKGLNSSSLGAPVTSMWRDSASGRPVLLPKKGN